MVELRKGNPRVPSEPLQGVELEPGHQQAACRWQGSFSGALPDRAMEAVETVLKRNQKNEEALILKGAILCAEAARCGPDPSAGMLAQG
jgi:hypothetical protein